MSRVSKMQDNFMKIQIHKIEVDKWCEGCRLQADPGSTYVLDWIQTNGPWFRETYEVSICKECKHWARCGHTLQRTCPSFEPE